MPTATRTGSTLIKEIKERCKDQNTKDILERIIRISMENSSIEMERQKLLPLLDASIHFVAISPFEKIPLPPHHGARWAHTYVPNSAEKIF